MRNFYLLLLLIAPHLLIWGQNDKTNTQYGYELRFSTLDEEAAFFDKINDYRYQGFPYAGDDYYSTPMGYTMCYRADSFFLSSQGEFIKLGLDSFESCILGSGSDDIYVSYIKQLRTLIDNSLYLHSDDDFPYALTNVRGIALFDVELLMTELILHKFESVMTKSEFEVLMNYHNLTMTCFRFWFTISYLYRGAIQMSGLTGDTYRACWPYLKLQLIITTPGATIRALIIKFPRPDMRPLSRPRKQYRSIG